MHTIIRLLKTDDKESDWRAAREKRHMRNFSRSQYEEGSCTHSLSKKGKEKKGYA